MEKQKLTGIDACICMHTALRKCCDSKITSAAYNLVHLICSLNLPEPVDPWRILGDLVAEELDKRGENKEWSIKHIVYNKKLEDKFDDNVMQLRKEGSKEPSTANTALYALSCTLQCFSDSDYIGMAEYLI